MLLRVTDLSVFGTAVEMLIGSAALDTRRDALALAEEKQKYQNRRS